MYASRPDVRADWDLPGRVCLYESPFRSRFRFPLPRFVRELCSHHCISPGQLTPNVWRVLMTIERFCEMHEIDFSIDDALTAYSLVECNKDKCRFQLSNRRKPPLIPKIPDPERHWKTRYFFVPFDSLELPDGCKIKRRWDGPSDIGAKFVSRHSKEVDEKIAKFMSFSKEDRRWDVVLAPSNLRGSRLWRQVSSPSRDTTCAEIAAYPKLQASRENIEILFPDMTPAETAFTDYVLSQPKVFPLSDDGANGYCGRKQLAKGKTSSGGSPSSGSFAPFRKRHVELGLSGEIDDECRLIFDRFDSVQLEFDSIANEVEKILFPEDEMRYDDLGIVVLGRSGVQHALQSVQTLISMINKVGDMEEQVKKSKEVEMMLQAEVDDLTSSKTEADALVVELQEQLTRHGMEVGHLHDTLAEVESLKLKLVGLGMAIAMAAAGAEIKTNASMVLDWESNKTNTWDIQKIYAEAKELVELEAMDPERTDDL